MKIARTLAAIGLIPWVFNQAFGEWSPPLKISERPSNYFAMQLAAGPAGTAIAAWSEAASGEPERLWSRMTGAGPWGWGAAIPVSDGTGTYRYPAAIAMHSDGTVLAAWLEQTLEYPTRNQIAVRQFVPGSGWGAIDKRSSLGYYPALAIAPDGRAHLLYVDNQGLLATTLPPGEGTWVPPVVLADDFTTPFEAPALVAGPGFAYTAYRRSGGGIGVAAYDASGWHPGTAVPSTTGSAVEPTLLINGTHVALTWFQPDVAQPDAEGTRPVVRLRGAAESFITPRSTCKVALAPDGATAAVCPVQGDAVPGCLEVPRRGPPEQAYYRYLEAYRRAPFGEWSPVEVISSRQKRVKPARVAPDNIRLLSNPEGSAFAFWPSEVPCQPGSSELLSRTWSPLSASWEPEEPLWADRAPSAPSESILTLLVDATVDAAGAPHALIYHAEGFSPDYSNQLFVRDGPAPGAGQAKGSK